MVYLSLRQADGCYTLCKGWDKGAGGGFTLWWVTQTSHHHAHVQPSALSCQVITPIHRSKRGSKDIQYVSLCRVSSALVSLAKCPGISFAQKSRYITGEAFTSIYPSNYSIIQYYLFSQMRNCHHYHWCKTYPPLSNNLLGTVLGLSKDLIQSIQSLKEKNPLLINKDSKYIYMFIFVNQLDQEHITTWIIADLIRKNILIIMQQDGFTVIWVNTYAYPFTIHNWHLTCISITGDFM